MSTIAAQRRQPECGLISEVDGGDGSAMAQKMPQRGPWLHAFLDVVGARGLISAACAR